MARRPHTNRELRELRYARATIETATENGPPTARLTLPQRFVARGITGRSIFLPEQWRAIVTWLKLSPREAQIAGRILNGDKEARIASQLRISTRTVHTHCDRLYRKLGVRSRSALVVQLFLAFLELNAAAGGCIASAEDLVRAARRGV